MDVLRLVSALLQLLEPQAGSWLWPVQTSSIEQSEVLFPHSGPLLSSPYHPRGMALILTTPLKASVRKIAESFIRLMSSPVFSILPVWEDGVFGDPPVRFDHFLLGF